MFITRFKILKTKYIYLILFSSCTYDKGSPPPVPQLSAVSYAKDIKPIIEKNCYECHSTTAENPEKPGYAFFDKYEELKEYALKTSPTNASYTKIQARLRHIEFPGMPFKKDKLNDTIIAKIDSWIKAGAPNN